MNHCPMGIDNGYSGRIPLLVYASLHLYDAEMLFYQILNNQPLEIAGLRYNPQLHQYHMKQ